MHDLLIKNANIVDGTGAAAFAGDVAVVAGKIVAVTRASSLGVDEPGRNRQPHAAVPVV
jgi:N-acyl-D-amino-acid deacylase